MTETMLSGIPDLGRFADNKSFHRDLKAFLQADDALRNSAIDLSRSYADSIDDDVLSDVARRHSVSLDEVLQSLVVALVVRHSVDNNRRSPDDAMELLRKAADGDEELVELVNKHETALRSLMTVTDKDQLETWTRQAVGSFIPRLVDIEATWEIRPVSNEDGKAVAFAPVVLLRLESDSAARTGEMVVQLDTRALSKLRSVLERLDENEAGIADCCANLCAAVTTEAQQ